MSESSQATPHRTKRLIIAALFGVAILYVVYEMSRSTSNYNSYMNRTKETPRRVEP